MHVQEIEFIVKSKGGVVTKVGKSTISQPKAHYNGKSMKWHEDKPKKDTQNKNRKG